MNSSNRSCRDHHLLNLLSDSNCTGLIFAYSDLPILYYPKLSPVAILPENCPECVFSNVDVMHHYDFESCFICKFIMCKLFKKNKIFKVDHKTEIL